MKAWMTKKPTILSKGHESLLFLQILFVRSNPAKASSPEKKRWPWVERDPSFDWIFSPERPKRRSSCQPTGGVTGAIFEWLSSAILKVCLHPGGSFLFIDLMLHLSHLKQFFNQPIHLTHELILGIQIIWGRVDFNGDSTVKSHCWHRVSNLWPSNPGLLWLLAE